MLGTPETPTSRNGEPEPVCERNFLDKENSVSRERFRFPIEVASIYAIHRHQVNFSSP
jgi:hypothetical protein